MPLKARWMTCLSAALTLSASSAFATEKLLVVADEWPPFSGATLPNMGISLDVTQAVLVRAGYQVELAILPWTRVVSGAKSGEYDIITSLFLDTEFEKSLTYSDPFFTTEVKFVRKAGSDIVFDGLDSLKPYVIAVGTGFLYEPEFDSATYLNKFEVTTAIQGVRMVAAGRVDLTLDSTDVIRHAIQSEAPQLIDQVELFGPPLATPEIHMAVSKTRTDHEEIAAAFNAALVEMKADGSLDALLQKHTQN
ncbi:amino acid ABC transporter substrate-binding protein [Roseobacter cerasinus]|uniref:Amino acid ABC transporter substrate-binding protein n=1 Tax=Roseobacter cerasinus TaxID=2602289 RepID=A0A640VMM5_9RHOB|nr:transporter substrate-binding domain-containing protein [Roseobacter cerasinus]GFE48894.1 amino acid ABC transporter substrate-binding protein [Roseobacter cerasinus]